MADCVSPSLLQLVGLLPLLHLGVLGVERDLPVYQGGSSSLHREEDTRLSEGECSGKTWKSFLLNSLFSGGGGANP